MAVPESPARSAGDDWHGPACSSEQALNGLGVAGEDTVTEARNQHQRGVDRVLGTRAADQCPGGAPRILIDRPDVDAAKQSRQPRLPTLGITPYLGYDDRVAAKLHTVALRHPQPSEQRAVIALRRHERACVEN